MAKIAIIVLGAPGSGKTTQAEKLAEEFGLVHFNTGEVIKDILDDPANQNDPIILREKKIYDSGVLNTDEWVNALVVKKTAEIAIAGKGVVFSGSPRRLTEAQALLPELASLYGKENVFAILLVLDFDTALSRVKARHICSKCGLPALSGEKICQKCGGEIIVRTLDDPAKFKTRFDEYHKKTEPVIDFVKSINMIMAEIDGAKRADEIHREISEFIKSRLK